VGALAAGDLQKQTGAVRRRRHARGDCALVAIAREARVTAQVVGAGDEYKRVKEIAATGSR
jgi:hypothetical protein